MEETARLEKKDVLTGRVRVRTLVDVEERTLEETLDTEIVDVSRVPFDTPVDRAPEVRTEGDVIIVPVVEEVLVVEKRLVLKEELHIKRRVVQEAVSVPVSVRKQHAVVDRETVAGEQNREEE
jgi:uncharacterized protein (TIGR02271 family)